MENRLYRIFPPINGVFYTWNFSDQWLTEAEKEEIETKHPYRVIPVSLVGIPSEKEMNKYTWENINPSAPIDPNDDCTRCEYLERCRAGDRPRCPWEDPWEE